MKTKPCRRFCSRALSMEKLEDRSLLAVFDLLPVATDGEIGSLRWAVQQANSNGEMDTINLAPGTYALTQVGAFDDSGTTGDLDIADDLAGVDLRIAGAPTGQTILDATDLGDRVFDILTGANIVFESVTIQGGQTSSGGGGIRNRGTVTLNSAILTGNSASAGGGVLNSGEATLNVTASTISNNVAQEGGGIFNDFGATATITTSTMSENLATHAGGAILGQFGSKLTIIDSTLSENTAIQGGAIKNSGDATFTRVTLSQNSVTGQGGAVWDLGTITISNSTIAFNRADSDGDGVGKGGGIFITTGAVTLHNTIAVANVTGKTGDETMDDVSLGALGVLHEESSYNLFSTNFTGLAGPGNQMSDDVAAVLDPVLRLNGGSTKTHALLPGSPAIDAGIDAGNAGRDQRGVRRPFDFGGVRDGVSDGDQSDIGAFELLDTLSVGDVVFEDRNTSGAFEPSFDRGIDNVVVNLYRDDGETVGRLDVNDTWMASDATTGGGLYLFHGLVPDDYIIEVDVSNFAVGGPLYEHLSLPGIANANSNIDDDDNGEPVSQFGVATGVVSLNSNSEPTDEDANNNTNLTVDFGFVGLDFGDALGPAYPTLRGDDGARHVLGSDLALGLLVDSEFDAQTDDMASGDDSDANDDEDGVTFTTPLKVGEPAVAVVMASGPGLLNAWIDYNADGDWDDSGEQVFADEQLEFGVNTLSFLVPESATPTTAPGASKGWLESAEETDTRLVLATVPYDDPEEKDIAAADLNRDGWTDLVVVRKKPFSRRGASTDLLLINHRGTLVDQTELFSPEFLSKPTDARDVFIMDFDNDGWDDVAIATTFEQQPKFYYNLGVDSDGNWLGLADQSESRFPHMDISPVAFCALWGGDVSGDGLPDLYFANYTKEGLAEDVLLINNGDGTFIDESHVRLGELRNSAFGTSVEIADVDNDGDNDIIKTSAKGMVPPWNEQGIFILFNEDGKFRNYQTLPTIAPYMFTTGDLTNDGVTDFYVVEDGRDYVNIATANISADESVNFSQRAIVSTRTRSFGGNVKMADLDGDGDLDIGVADVDVDQPPCDSSRQLVLLRNEDIGSGNLINPSPTQESEWGVSTYDFEFVDIDNDGTLDIFHGRCNGYAVLMIDVVLANPVHSFARFRFSTTAGLSPAGLAVDGEVEDYQVHITSDQTHDEGSQESNLDPNSADQPDLPTQARQPGDANEDWQFDQWDIIQVLRSVKYNTGQQAQWDEGDWDKNGVFNRFDIVAALQTGNYRQGPYASLAKSARDADAVFDEMGLQQLIRPI